jgi:hypothetical protein
MKSPLPQVSIPDGYRMRDVQLEMSLKPFYDTTPATREAVCREIFTQWSALCRHAESVSIMLWTGDGSEILEYDRDLHRPFEWGRYQGSANPHRVKINEKARKKEEDRGSLGLHASDRDPDGIGLHRRSYLYRENPAAFTFTWLKELVADLKRIGHEITGKTIYVGETFDIGPEFAVSRFKYDWHREILAGGNSLFECEFISCEGVLKGDERKYAGFPTGIPEGTPFGTFLGRQCRIFFEDMGFDFLWFSNGFGFALEPWALIGNVFDGMNFHPEAIPGTRERILKFWRDLRGEFPLRYTIRTRGTNLCTGIDLGSDASPLRDLYAGNFNLDAPVNSPWAALDGDFGLELSGWMSHMGRHPGDTFRFRYYLHDPWWKNSPYLDRYERNPHDLYLPSSVSRIQQDGKVEIARDIAFLTIDDSDGMMPLAVPNEVTAHLLRAREFAPDEAGPVVWAYPFDDFHDRVEKEGKPEIPFHADSYIGTVINDSVPLNTVADLGELPRAIAARPDLPVGRVFLSPVPPPGSQSERTLLGIVEKGGGVLLYGPLPEASAFRLPLGLGIAQPLEGDFELELHYVPQHEDIASVGRTLRHTPFLSAGGFAETAMGMLPAGVRHLATARRGGEARIASAMAQSASGGQIAWVRASLSTSEFDPAEPEPIKGPILRPMDSKKFFPYGRLARFALDAMGWQAAVPDRASSDRTPYVTIHRHRNAFHYSGYHLDENAILRLRHPLGAPLLTFRRQKVVDGATEITGSRAWSQEARVFVQSGEDGNYRAQFECPVAFGVYRRLIVRGCRKATLNFLVDPGSGRPIRILRDPVFPFLVGEFVEPKVIQTPYGPAIRVEQVEGSILFEW